jgi:DNA polymerase-3 subunit delta
LSKINSITHATLFASLKKKQFSNVYFLHGPEAFFIDDISGFIEKNVLGEGEREFNQVILYGKDTNAKQVVDNARQFPMMAPYRVVIIREAQAMADLADLANYLTKPSPQTVLVICHKYKSLDKRKALYKAATSHSVVFESKNLFDNQLPAWISQRAVKHKLQIGPEASVIMAEYLGANLSKIDNELEKLSLVVGEDHIVTSDEIKQHVGLSKDFNIFELNKAIGSKDILKANMIINYFASNPKSGPLVLVINTLTGYFSKIIIVQENSSMNDANLKNLAGIPNVFFVKEYRIAAKNFPKQKIIQIFSLLVEYDLRAKGIGNKSVSDIGLLRELIFKILH